MDEALKKKLTVGALVALVGLVVFLNLPEGTPAEEEYVDVREYLGGCRLAVALASPVN